MTVTCPHCQTKLSFSPKLQKGPIYTSNRVHVRGHLDDEGAYAMVSSYGNSGDRIFAYFELKGDAYCIAECTECRKEFVCLPYVGRPVWPLPETSVPEEIPVPIAKMLAEAKQAHAVGAETAALLTARTALIRMLRQESASSFKELASQGKLTDLLSQQANEIRLWANLTAHEDVPEDSPSGTEVEELVGYLEVLFDVLYVQPAKLQRLQEKRKRPD